MVIVDFHAHLYPRHFDTATALGQAIQNLQRLANRAGSERHALCLVLAEPMGFQIFQDLLTAGAPLGEGLEISVPKGLENCLRVTNRAEQSIFVFPGRQIVTSERLEVLAWFVDLNLPDRELSFAEVYEQVRLAGGTPVVNWSPGKWWGKRGRIVSQILDTPAFRPLALCDTTLRPTGYGLPLLMRKGSKLGLPILAGSDPLPLAGEEALLGTYATAFRGTLDEHNPAASLLHLITSSPLPIRIGRRSLPWTLSRRLSRYYRSKR